jgi:hypothetical protein
VLEESLKSEQGRVEKEANRRFSETKWSAAFLPRLTLRSSQVNSRGYSTSAVVRSESTARALKIS